MEVLYNVIIENQKTRTSLLKWKLVLSATLASIGLGTRSSILIFSNVDLVLCAIPFVVVYSDILCSHLSLRVQVIGRFVRINPAPDALASYMSNYERFVDQTRNPNTVGVSLNVFALESWAMYSSSIVACLLIIVYGTFLALDDLRNINYAILFMISGLFGFVAEVVLRNSYMKRYRYINNVGILQE